MAESELGPGQTWKSAGLLSPLSSWGPSGLKGTGGFWLVLAAVLSEHLVGELLTDPPKPLPPQRPPRPSLGSPKLLFLKGGGGVGGAPPSRRSSRPKRKF